MPVLFVVFSMLLMLLGVSKYCLADNLMVFGGVPNIPPLSFVQEGSAKGFFPDVLSETGKRAGLEIIIVLYPFKRLNRYLQLGELDGTISIFHKKEREGYLLYSKYPVLVSRTLVFVKKGKEFTFRSISDLYGKKFGAIAGWSLNNLELERAVKEKKIFIDEAERHDQNLHKLMLNRFDGLIATEHLTWYHANQLGVAESVAALETQVAENRTFFAVSKHTHRIKDHKRIMERMESALNEIVLDGTYETFLMKYQLTSKN